ncbi:hypothetical protein REPUB_Repub15cG0086800 [Reevesia pubescens]
MTFSNDSYRGNQRLCCPPLSRKCNEVVPGKPPPKEDVDSLLDGFSDWRIVLIGYGCGLGRNLTQAICLQRIIFIEHAQAKMLYVIISTCIQAASMQQKAAENKRTELPIPGTFIILLLFPTTMHLTMARKIEILVENSMENHE